MAELKTEAIKPNKGKPKAYKHGAQLWFGRTRHLFVSRYKLDVETNFNTCTLQESTYYDGLEDLKGGKPPTKTACVNSSNFSET
jgi:hypothetical protein